MRRLVFILSAAVGLAACGTTTDNANDAFRGAFDIDPPSGVVVIHGYYNSARTLVLSEAYVQLELTGPNAFPVIKEQCPDLEAGQATVASVRLSALGHHEISWFAPESQGPYAVFSSHTCSEMDILVNRDSGRLFLQAGRF